MNYKKKKKHTNNKNPNKQKKGKKPQTKVLLTLEYIILSSQGRSLKNSLKNKIFPEA